MTALHHGRYVFTALYIGVSSLVVFSSDVFSRLSFVRLCFRSLRFHRHSGAVRSDMDVKQIKTLLKSARESIAKKEYKEALKHCKVKWPLME